MRNFKLFMLLPTLLLMLSACENGDDVKSSGLDKSKQAEDPYVVFDDAHLTLGREIWLNTCKGCHALGIAGSPAVTDKAAWQSRLKQGKATLYEHAINGFFGPEYTEMPARGGNQNLSDEQVKAAVDYMLALVEHN